MRQVLSRYRQCGSCRLVDSRGVTIQMFFHKQTGLWTEVIQLSSVRHPYQGAYTLDVHDASYIQ